MYLYLYLFRRTRNRLSSRGTPKSLEMEAPPGRRSTITVQVYPIGGNWLGGKGGAWGKGDGVFCVGGLGPGRCGTNILPGDRRGGGGEDGREVSVASDDDETEILVSYFAGAFVLPSRQLSDDLTGPHHMEGGARVLALSSSRPNRQSRWW